MEWNQQLEKVKDETRQKITAARQQQKDGTGDKAVLAAHMGTLTNQMKDLESQQTKTKEAVKKRMTDLGYDWNESGSTTVPDKSAAAACAWASAATALNVMTNANHAHFRANPDSLEVTALIGFLLCSFGSLSNAVRENSISGK